MWVRIPPAASLPRGPGRRTIVDGAHLTVLWAFAVAQPLFNLLGKNPEFFAARASPALDIVAFGVGLVLLPPALLLGLELIVGRLHHGVRRGLHLLLVAALVALVAVQALKKSFDASDAVLVAGAAATGALAALAYARAHAVQSFMTVLSPAPAIFLVVFLFFSPVSKLTFPGEASARATDGTARAPVVMVLFDELPTLSLLDGRGRIDAGRYPAFASLASDSTWFRNAYTVYDSTERAQPAIMDGNYPEQDGLPIAADHPNSVFALLGRSHRMNVSEEATSVCPRDLCRDRRRERQFGARMESIVEDLGLVWLHVVSPRGVEAELPSVSRGWGDFGGDGEPASRASRPASTGRVVLGGDREERFDDWIDAIEPSRRPTLHFKHTLLPHVPWEYLPSGTRYPGGGRDPIPGLSDESYRVRDQVVSLYQRHLLQLGFADRKLGRLLRRLRQTGLYDRALVVVAADHGVAFEQGARDRRRLTRKNAAQVAPVPLLVKAPGQTAGRTDDAYVETVDILPTILDLLDVDSEGAMDGSSAFSPRVRARREVRVLERGSFEPIRFTAAAFERLERDALDRKLRLFGTGREGPGRLFEIAPDPELLGTAVSGVRVLDRSGSRARLADAEPYRSVDLRSRSVPSWITGYIEGDEADARDLAIAVNGRIAAVSRSFHLARDEGENFAAMVPEGVFRQGENDVGVFEITRSGGATALRRLGGV